MKPWDRDIQDLERYFEKTKEEHNIQLNSGSSFMNIIGAPVGPSSKNTSPL